jgi:hypothetical protein
MKLSKILALGLLLMLSCSPEKTTPGVGEVKDGVYTHAFFNLEFVVPDGWTVGTRKEVENFLEVGSETMKKLNDSLTTVIDTNDFSEAILFIMNKNPKGQENSNRSVGVPSSLIMSSERVSENPELKTSEDYLVNLKKEYQQMNQLKMRFQEGFEQISVGEKKFKVLKGNASLGFVDITQEYWCTLENGYALVMILTYSNPFDRIEMHSAIKNMSAS